MASVNKLSTMNTVIKVLFPNRLAELFIYCFPV